MLTKCTTPARRIDSHCESDSPDRSPMASAATIARADDPGIAAAIRARNDSRKPPPAASKRFSSPLRV